MNELTDNDCQLSNVELDQLLRKTLDFLKDFTFADEFRDCEKRIKCKDHRNLLTKKAKLTLVYATFVLPTFDTRRDKGMMTNGLLNQDFVFELLNVIIENYLRVRGKPSDKKYCPRSVRRLTRTYLRLFKNLQRENLRILNSTNLVDRSEGSFGDEVNDLEVVFQLTVLNFELGQEKELSTCNRPKCLYSRVFVFQSKNRSVSEVPLN